MSTNAEHELDRQIDAEQEDKLVGALEQLSDVFHAVASYVERSKESLSFPRRFVRELTVARCKLYETIVSATKDYCLADEDIDAFAMAKNDLPDNIPDWFEDMLDDLYLRLKRRRTEVGKILKEFGVSVKLPRSGDHFDPDRHEVVDPLFRTDGRQFQVASVTTPLFEWQDEYGQTQCIRSVVTLAEVDGPAVKNDSREPSQGKEYQYDEYSQGTDEYFESEYGTRPNLPR